MYLLMYVIGFILVIGGIWLLLRENAVEGMADTSTVVMAALSSNNTHFADVGLTNLPNWSAAGGTYKQLSGSMGRLIGVDSANRARYGTKFDISGSAFNWLIIPGEVKQISFDYPMVVGLTPSNTVVYIDNIPLNPQTATWKSVGGSSATKTFNYIAMNNGMAVGAGTDNKIWYCTDIRSPTWLDISTGLLSGIVVKNIAFDGDDVSVVDTNNNVYFANNMGEVNDNVGVAKSNSDFRVGATPAAAAPGTPVAGVMPNWKTLAKKMKQVSIRNHMGLGIGEDNRIYFAASLKDGNWAATGSPPSTAIWAELYYPVGGDVISFRPAGTSIRGGVSPCPFGYTLSGARCYSNCPAGYKDDGETCSYLTTVAGAQVAVNDIKSIVESCGSGYSLTPTGNLKCTNLVDGSSFPLITAACPTNHISSPTNLCMSTCPSTFTSSLTDCIAPTTPKTSSPAVTNLYSCPSGTILTTDNKCLGSCPAGYVPECMSTGTNALKCTGNCVYNTNSVSAKQPYTPASIPSSITRNISYNTLPNNNDDQSIPVVGTVRYVRIRPSTTSGDGYLTLSQIIVLDKNGTNIARGKTVTASGTYPTDDPPSTVVDGSANLRKPTSSKFVGKNNVIPSNGVWSSATNNRSSEFIEVDLGSNTAISAIRLIGRADYNFTTNGIDRMTGVIVEVYSSTILLAPTPINQKTAGYKGATGNVMFFSLDLNTLGSVNNARYIRVRPPSRTAPSGTTGLGYDGYFTVTEFKYSYRTDVFPYRVYAIAPIFATSNPHMISNINASTYPTTPWTSATPNTENEFLEMDLGKENKMTLDIIPVYGGLVGGPDRLSGTRVELLSEVISTAGLDCPTGYFKGFNVCFQNCQEGYDYSTETGLCVFGRPTAAPQTPATYTPPCPSGATQVGSLCYSACPVGTTDADSTTCKPPNTKRTQGPAPTVVPPRLCNPPLIYVESIKACSPACPAETNPVYSGGQTTCTKDNVNRTSTDAVLSYTCNANEILRNGVCVTKCPDGSAPDGDLCVPEMKIVTPTADANIKCTSSPYNSSKKWMCESSDDFNTLVTNPTSTTTYISVTDQICVTDNPTTKMYFCITGAEAKSGLNPLTSMKPDFRKTCQSITKSYIDLSNNLTNLIKIRDGMQVGSTQLGAARDNLNSIYGQMTCTAASGNKEKLCSQIKTAASSIGTNSSDLKTTLDTVIPSLTEALNSRDSLLGYKSKFQCP